jgi:hypothetical protein
MQKLPYMFAAAAISGLTSTAGRISASPLAGRLSGGSTVPAELHEGLVQKVHSGHFKRRWSKRLGWHQHRHAYGYSGSSAGLISVRTCTSLHFSGRPSGRPFVALAARRS